MRSRTGPTTDEVRADLHLDTVTDYLDRSGVWRRVSSPLGLVLWEGPDDDLSRPIRLALPDDEDNLALDRWLDKALTLLAAVERRPVAAVVEAIRSSHRARSTSTMRDGRGTAAPTGPVSATRLSSPRPASQQIPLPRVDDRRGYRGPAVCELVGISYHQLDYWTTTGLIRASVRDAEGSGTQRLFGFEDIVQLKLIKRLLDTGVTLQRIRQAIELLRTQGLSPRDVTLVSDGTGIYALDDQRQVIDVLGRGQGVFAIAVAPVVEETEAEVTDLPFELAS